MTLVGTSYVVYVVSSDFRELVSRFADPDEFGAIYTVVANTRSKITRPSEDDLSTAHWHIFLSRIAEFAELRRASEDRGFDACWDVHWLDIESGDDLINDAQALSAI